MPAPHPLDRRLPLLAAAGFAVTVVSATGHLPARAAESTPPALAELGADSVRPAIAAPSTYDATPATEPGPLPFAVQKSDSSVALRTGLSDLGAYQQRELQRKIDSIKPHLPANMRLPKAAPVAKSALDVWTRVEANGLAAQTNSGLKTSLGADYNVDGAARTGVVAERSEPATQAFQSASPENDKLSAYVTLQAAPGLSVDTRANWEATGGAAPDGQGLAGQHEKTSLSVAPRLGHRFDVDASGTTLEPYVTMKHEIDMASGLAGGGGGASAAATDSAGAGVTLAKPDAYSLGVSTSVDGIDRAEPASVSSKLQLKVPLR